MAKPVSNEICGFLIDQVGEHPRDIVSITAEKFSITRQAVHRHMAKLVKEGVVEAKGTTRNKEYALAQTQYGIRLSLADTTDEDAVWRELIEPCLQGLPDNVLRIANYGFTEMLNNAFDHSEGKTVHLGVVRSSKNISLIVADDGVGIFEKIKRRFNLEDRRHAILALSKGKLTTDPARHTGQGIFFASRMFDKFMIMSGDLYFWHVRQGEDWLFEYNSNTHPGTAVSMIVAVHSTVTPKEVFDRYTDLESDDYDFSKTHVPLRLAKYGKEDLVSRSQAKRVLAGFERFKEVLLDFAGIDSIGQAFADEIFRVFARSHPGIGLLPINAGEDVTRMIRRATAALKAEGTSPA